MDLVAVRAELTGFRIDAECDNVVGVLIGRQQIVPVKTQVGNSSLGRAIAGVIDVEHGWVPAGIVALGQSDDITGFPPGSC